MNLLLDTHALIWFALGDNRLPGPARAAIEEADEVLVSAASAWEVATKFRKGKLPEAEFLVRNWSLVVQQLGMSALSITPEHALRSGVLPISNPDPFDRMLVAQALVEGVAIVSNEAAWADAGVSRIWDETLRERAP